MPKSTRIELSKLCSLDQTNHFFQAYAYRLQLLGFPSRKVDLVPRGREP